MTADTQQAADVARSITGPCTCDIAYTGRKLVAPDCAWHNYGLDIADALAAVEDRGRLRERAECAETADGMRGLIVVDAAEWLTQKGADHACIEIAAAIRARTAPQPVAPQGGTAEYATPLSAD